MTIINNELINKLLTFIPPKKCVYVYLNSIPIEYMAFINGGCAYVPFGKTCEVYESKEYEIIKKCEV